MTQATEEKTSVSTPVPKEDLEYVITMMLVAPDLVESAIKAAIIKAIREQP